MTERNGRLVQRKKAMRFYFNDLKPFYAIVFTLLQQLSEGLAVLRETEVLKKINDKWLGVLQAQGISLGTIWKS